MFIFLFILCERNAQRYIKTSYLIPFFAKKHSKVGCADLGMGQAVAENAVQE